MGADELSVADTIGMANPRESYELFKTLKEEFPDVLLTAHFHDTRKMAIANIFAALQAGINRLIRLQVAWAAVHSHLAQQAMLRLKMLSICSIRLVLKRVSM